MRDAQGRSWSPLRTHSTTLHHAPPSPHQGGGGRDPLSPSRAPLRGQNPHSARGNLSLLQRLHETPDFTVPPTRTHEGQKPPRDKDTRRLALGPEELTMQFQTSLQCETPPVSGQFPEAPSTPPPGLELLRSWEVKLRFCRQ